MFRGQRTERDMQFLFPGIVISQTLPRTLFTCSYRVGDINSWGICPLWGMEEKGPVSGLGWKEFQPGRSFNPWRAEREMTLSDLFSSSYAWSSSAPRSLYWRILLATK